MEDGEAEPQQACQLWLLMELAREPQTPTQNATTTQETYSRETEEEQPEREITEATAEPEAEQNEADQMRDTGVGSAAATSQTTVEGGDDDITGEPCWNKMTRNQRKIWKKFGGREE